MKVFFMFVQNAFALNEVDTEEANTSERGDADEERANNSSVFESVLLVYQNPITKQSEFYVPIL